MGAAAAWRVDSAAPVMVRGAVQRTWGVLGVVSGGAQGKQERGPRRLGAWYRGPPGEVLLSPHTRADVWAYRGLLGLPVLPP